MNNKKFETFFDCGTSKLRAGAISKHNSKEGFYLESNFFYHSSIESEIKNIVTSLERDTNEYLDNVNLMIDCQEMLSIGISICKKLDGSKIKKKDIQFLLQNAKQQILRNYEDQNIIHIIIKNYKVDDTDHTFFPENINCNLISLDILFICMPKKIIEYYKDHFFRLDISVNQIFCASYAKSVNYKNNFFLNQNVLFIDVGFEKTSIIYYNKDELTFFDVLPIGGNHITKDISKILNLDLKKAEEIKLYFDKHEYFLKEKKLSPDIIQKIISARVDEILELSLKTIRLNLSLVYLDQYKIVLTGEGSKILDNKFREKILFPDNLELLEERTEDICESALKLTEGFNKQEVVVTPKKQNKSGFFEQLFHLFK